MTYEETMNFIKENSEEKVAAFSARLTPTADKIYGVRVPLLRELAKRIAKENPEEFLRETKNSLEEKMLHGFVIGYMKCDFNEFVKNVKYFAGLVDNWAVCDTACSTFAQIKKHREEFLPVITEFLSGGDFDRRLGYVMLLDYYVDKEYAPYIFAACDEVKEADGYYVKMAVSWLISVCYVKIKDETEEYFTRHKLDKFTFNKAIQKITESFRVADSDKEKLKKMKVK